MGAPLKRCFERRAAARPPASRRRPRSWRKRHGRRRLPRSRPPWRWRSPDSAARRASGRRCALRVGGRGTWMRDHQLARRQRGAAHAGDELPERQAAAAGRPAISTSASSASRQRHAVGRRRGVAQIAGEGARVLDLPAADLAGGLLQAVEQRRQIGLDQLAPGRGGAQPPARRDRPKCRAKRRFRRCRARPRRSPGRPAPDRNRCRRPAPSCGRASAVSASSRLVRTEISTHIVRVRTMPYAPAS